MAKGKGKEKWRSEESHYLAEFFISAAVRPHPSSCCSYFSLDERGRKSEMEN
jgi:hypothetical protein